MATNFLPEQTQSFPRNRDVQNGDSGDHKTVPPKRRMGHFTGLQRCVLPHSYCSKVQKIPKVSSEQAQLPVHLSLFWSGNGPVGIHQSGQGSKTDGSARGIRIHQYLLDLCDKLGWVVNFKKLELTPQQVFNFVDYRFDLLTGQVLPTQVRWTSPQQKLKFIKARTIPVSDRASDSNRETGVVGSPSHATYSVVSEASMACSRESGKGYSSSPFTPSTSGLVAKRERCSLGTAFTPPSTRSNLQTPQTKVWAHT